MKRACAAAILLALAGCGTPLPPEKAAYVGSWRAPEHGLTIWQSGRAKYWRSDHGAMTRTEGPIKEWRGDNFVVGIGPLTGTFVVSAPPHAGPDGAFRMTVDGVEYTRSGPP